MSLVCVPHIHYPADLGVGGVDLIKYLLHSSFQTDQSHLACVKNVPKIYILHGWTDKFAIAWLDNEKNTLACGQMYVIHVDGLTYLNKLRHGSSTQTRVHTPGCTISCMPLQLSGQKSRKFPKILSPGLPSLGFWGNCTQVIISSATRTNNEKLTFILKLVTNVRIMMILETWMKRAEMDEKWMIFL